MKRFKFISLFFSLLIALNGYAQPDQPETSSFTPLGSSDLVNLSTGDFTYNIPLMEELLATYLLAENYLNKFLDKLINI